MNSLTNDEVKSVFSSFSIPPKPALLTEIQDAFNVAEPDLGHVAELISHDVGLSAAILKVINSASFGMCRAISEIKQAVFMLGADSVSNLVTGVMLKTALIGKSCISLERFWDDSFELAMAMTYLGNHVKNKVPVEQLFTVGLFENCGIPILSFKFDDYRDTLIEANRDGQNSIELEELKYQTNHAVLGYFVASSWHLPKDICTLILRHHELDFYEQQNTVDMEIIFAVLKASENMLELAKRQKCTADWSILGEKSLDVLGISEIDYTDMIDDFTELTFEEK